MDRDQLIAALARLVNQPTTQAARTRMDLGLTGLESTLTVEVVLRHTLRCPDDSWVR